MNRREVIKNSLAAATLGALADFEWVLPALAQGGWHDLVGSWSEYSAGERALAWRVLDQLAGLGQDGADHDILLSRRAPRPLAQLRIAPRL